MLKVVYDVDNVLWPLNARVFESLNIDCLKDTNYNLSNNPFLTPEQRQAILDAFHQAETFTDIKFYPGADEILQAEPLGASIRIHSHCYSMKIAELKRVQLQRLLPQLEPDLIKMSLISTNPNNKQIDADTFVFIDDNPYNIISSKAPVNIVLRQPWNTTTESIDVLTKDGKTLVEADWQAVLPGLLSQPQLCVVMAKNLKEVNQIVQCAVKLKQEVKYDKS